MLAEFPEKEIQLQQMEAQSQQVLEKTSEDGPIHIIHDMKQIQESWTDVYNISLSLYKYVNNVTLRMFLFVFLYVIDVSEAVRSSCWSC